MKQMYKDDGLDMNRKWNGLNKGFNTETSVIIRISIKL